MQNSELIAGSQYPQTTRSLLKIGLLLIVALFLGVTSSWSGDTETQL